MWPFFWFPVWFWAFPISGRSSHSCIWYNWYNTGLLQKIRSYGILGQIFIIISSFLSYRRLRVVLDVKASQEYPVNAGVPQGSILGLTPFLWYINDLPDNTLMAFRMMLSVILLSMLIMLLSTLNVMRYLICGNT